MPLYYFQFTNPTHASNGGALELQDDEAARREAELEASELRNYPGEGDWSDWTVRVVDDAGRLVVSVPVAETRRPRVIERH